MYKIWRDKKENVTKIVIDPWLHVQHDERLRGSVTKRDSSAVR